MTRPMRLPGDQIVALVSLVMTGIALLSLGVFPTRELEFLRVLGSPLGIPFSERWLAALLLVLLVCIGMDALVRKVTEHPRLSLSYSATFWVLPALVTLAAVGLVPQQLGQGAGWVGSMLVLGALFGVVVVAECGAAQIDGPLYRVARLGLNLATYGAAFALYALIYGMDQRSLISSTAVILVTVPLALELLRSTEEELSTTWLHASVIALVTGQISWPLNAMGLRAIHGGMLLLLAFYLLSGLSQQYLAGRLNRRVAFEFFALTAVLGGLVSLSVLQRPDYPESSPWLPPELETGLEGAQPLPPEGLEGSDIGTTGEWPLDREGYPFGPDDFLGDPSDAAQAPDEPPVPARPRDRMDKP